MQMVRHVINLMLPLILGLGVVVPAWANDITCHRPYPPALLLPRGCTWTLTLNLIFLEVFKTH